MFDASEIADWASAVRTRDEGKLVSLWAGFAPTVARLAEEWLEKTLLRAGREADADGSSDPSSDAPLVDRVFQDEIQFRGSDELWRLVADVTVSRLERELEGSSRRLATSAELAAEMVRFCRPLLDELADPDLESIALYKLAGKTNEEIAEQMQRTRRTIQRMIRLIRDIWLGQIES